MPTEQIIRDRFGHYAKNTGTTRDRSGNKIAEGNILAMLIMAGHKPR